MPPERTELVVVGAGLLGLATARALHNRGRDVVVLEQATVGHDRGGSKGATRIFRYGYTDPLYVRMAMAARPLWAELEADASRRLLTPTPQLTFGAGLDQLARAMSEAGAPARPMPAREVHEVYPDLHVDGDAILEPDSAVIDASRTLDALRDAVAENLREQTRVLTIDDDGRRVRVETTSGDVEAGRAIVCPGPWSAELLPLSTFATLEHVAYFAHRSGAPPPMPIFIEHGQPAAYGLPTPTTHAYKLGFHHAGLRVDPDTDDVACRPERVAELSDAARRWLPAFDPQPMHVETCLYDNTPNDDFVLDRTGNVVVGAGTSGHGFKFGPLLGELLADLATNQTPSLDLGRFARRPG